MKLQNTILETLLIVFQIVIAGYLILFVLMALVISDVLFNAQSIGFTLFYISIFFAVPAFLLYKIRKYRIDKFGHINEGYSPPIDTPGAPPRTGNFKGLEDLIAKFVLSYHDSESEWPNQIDIPTWDIESFEELLIDRGMSIHRTTLESYIEREINRTIKTHFTKSMDAKVKKLKYENTQQEINSISEIYSNHFDENSWELGFFTQYLENKYGEKLEPPCSPVNWVKRLIGLQNTPSNKEYIKELILSIRLKKEKRDRIQKLESIINSDQKKIDRVGLDFIDYATGIEFERIQ